MRKIIRHLRHSLGSKLIIVVGLTLLITISAWAYFNIRYQKQRLMGEIVAGTDRLSDTIRLGAHYAMMLNSRDDINQIIQNIARQKEIETIRIYNKQGQIKFSNRPDEVDTKTDIKAEACDICHCTEPPSISLPLAQRTRIFKSRSNYRLLGVISPILNEPGCATDDCHVHPPDKKVLGALDVVVSLKATDREIVQAEKRLIALAGLVFVVASSIIFIFVLRFVNRPVRRLIEETRRIAREEDPEPVRVDQDDEMGQLARAINQMCREVTEKRQELNKQRDEYQFLFEQVPCLITVQDRNFKLLRYNREFAERFDPRPGDFCYHAYKGRNEKCDDCPVALTFADGRAHSSEEFGVNKDGSPTYWLVHTAPIKDGDGNIVAAMEMSLDITKRKLLEQELAKSEKKYHEIFNYIPTPLFVLDDETLEILDCNRSVKAVYGHDSHEVIGRSFLSLFAEDERERYAAVIRTSAMINQVRHLHKSHRPIFVNIRISPAEYPGKKVLLVITSDITQRLEAEQQLIQASKMATLGEMATGIAHELNQPLSVIKTASSFFIKKLDSNRSIEKDVLTKMLHKIDKNVDRAGRIINHMRQFARKSDLDLEKVQLNQVLANAFEIFSQQLKLRGIEVVWDIDDQLPIIQADASRLEQVMINLLINARDAIEERWGERQTEGEDKKITLKTESDGRRVRCSICDTGTGVPANLRDKIFEPFFTTKEVGKGTGLGLSISYRIVHDCGGTIKVIRNQPRGACFVLEFPVLQTETGDNGQTHARYNSTGR